MPGAGMPEMQARNLADALWDGDDRGDGEELIPGQQG